MDGQANLGVVAGSIPLPSPKELAENTGSGFEWNRTRDRQSVTTGQTEVLYVPLDGFLRVNVLPRKGIRTAVTAFLSEHCRNPRGISFFAARGKLIAEMAAIAGNHVAFVDLVKHTNVACKKSESRAIRSMDPRELARLLCTA